MRKLRSQEEIMSSWKGDLDKPTVSICCITYNHEPYIEDALEGFLIQDTDFPFEILIHDDASTDRTAEIIREYEARYPKLIKPIYQIENQYSQGRPATLIAFPYCIGTYIALCEGDDYWVDPSKIQKQVDFLDANPDYVISGHDAVIVDETGNRLSESKLSDLSKRDFSGEDLILGKGSILTMSRVFRNIDLTDIPERRMVKNGDDFFISLIGRFGKSHFHLDIQSAVYRVHSGGIWSTISAREKYDSKINTLYWMYRYYLRIGQERYEKYYWNKYLKSVFRRSSVFELTSVYLIRIFNLAELRFAIRRIFNDMGK